MENPNEADDLKILDLLLHLSSAPTECASEPRHTTIDAAGVAVENPNDSDDLTILDLLPIARALTVKCCGNNTPLDQLLAEIGSRVSSIRMRCADLGPGMRHMVWSEPFRGGVDNLAPVGVPIMFAEIVLLAIQACREVGADFEAALTAVLTHQAHVAGLRRVTPRNETERVWQQVLSAMGEKPEAEAGR